MTAPSAALAALLLLFLWSAAHASAAEVPVVFAKYANITYAGTAPFSNMEGDTIFRGCNPSYGESSVLYIPGSNGVFRTKNNLVENMPNGTEYCRKAGPGEYFTFYYGTTGRIFFNTRIDNINIDNSATVLFTLDENYNPTNIKEFSTPLLNPIPLSNGALCMSSYGVNPPRYIVELINGAWTFQLANGTLPKNVTSGSCSFGVSQLSKTLVDNNNQPLIYCLQSNLTWAFIEQPVYTDLDQYDNKTRNFWFNGEDIVAFSGGNENGLVTGGTLYMGRLDGSIAASFNMIDYGEDFSYVRYDNYIWSDSLLWINKDLALVSTLQLPDIYDEYGAQSGGSIAIIVRDETGHWKIGGKIKTDDSVPIASVVQASMTKSNIIVYSYRDAQNRFISTYPLCFKDPLDVTCKQNIQLSSCDQNNPPAFTDAYSYADDGCIAPEVSVQSINFTNSTAVVRFERLGVKIGQCTVTFTCPSTNTPRGKTSASNRMAAQVSGIVTLLALIFVATM